MTIVALIVVADTATSRGIHNRRIERTLLISRNGVAYFKERVRSTLLIQSERPSQQARLKSRTHSAATRSCGLSTEFAIDIVCCTHQRGAKKASAKVEQVWLAQEALASCGLTDRDAIYFSA